VPRTDPQVLSGLSQLAISWVGDVAETFGFGIVLVRHPTILAKTLPT
jgi:hypothetical protein